MTAAEAAMEQYLNGLTGWLMPTGEPAHYGRNKEQSRE